MLLKEKHCERTSPGGVRSLWEAASAELRGGPCTSLEACSGHVFHTDIFISLSIYCGALPQVDNHIAELTVRETLDFAARVLGVGHKAGAFAVPLRHRSGRPVPC